MKKNILLPLLVLFVATTTAWAQRQITTDDLKWLTGSWHIDAGEVQIYENWQQETNGSYTGTGCVVNGKDTIVVETLRIENIGGHWVYIAQINQYNPVLFTLKPTAKAKELVFENLEHDNPQRVQYKWVNKNEIYARTEAIVNGQEVVEEYPYKRP